MKVIAKWGREDIAVVYVGETASGRRVEFVESVEPPIPREKKWVNIISTLYGCPISCQFCDAGLDYTGKLSAEDMLAQIDFLVRQRYRSNNVPSQKWKIQFARMGDPAFNSNVLDVLELLPERYDATGLLPSISTIAPRSTERFFGRLLEIKERLYPQNFQFQLSIHTTDPDIKRQLIPTDTWSFSQMADYGAQIFSFGGRKVTLNFALIDNIPVEANTLREYFNPEIFLIKLTPLNPTQRVLEHGLISSIGNGHRTEYLTRSFEDLGYDVILSIGELEENAIGSNCGQYISSIKESTERAYTYPMQELNENEMCMADERSK